ncbi:MAG: hypothetical protein A3F54_02995 [Candidatus Kerfeldbacteria bacterium RIFCSPHIGHO2_12_FULL_48_17]|uniref:Uncharacterized protein n=1 Tax=Candidatus Kerfeldbacteria bacterium RIFCSPHIGHO2_12_FULL_48_17 TaxID=1798542 RepID=A0A1G2B843_9BACT|nr:MAG: hypothetical protein A3F54_02995 [Candidatus Kerfeldbacteria bacterium RIFCSPHIGHO2_12_FULL_48_17]
MSDGVMKKIPVRNIKPDATIKIQGEEIPVLKSVHVENFLFLDVLIHGQKKTVLKEKPLTATQKIERAIAGSALSDCIRQYGKIKKFAWNEITLQNKKIIPMALYIEILNKALRQYEETGVHAEYEPPVEPVFGAFQQHYRYSFYETAQKHLQGFLPKVGYLYHPVNDTLTEVMETVDVRFEQIGDALEHWDELASEERTVLKKNLQAFIRGLIALADETGHILDLGAEDDSILHAARVIISRELRPIILYVQHPFIVPWKLVSGQKKNHLPILEQKPSLRLHPQVQKSLEKEPEWKNDILGRRLRQASYLEGFLGSLTQLKIWLEQV